MSKVQENMPAAREHIVPDDYRAFLNKWYCKKGNDYTHTSIAHPKTTLAVPDEHNHEFLEKYKSFMVKGYALHLTEKPKDPSMLRIDLDFRFPLPEDRTNLERLYTDFQVQNIIKHYCQVLETYLQVPSLDHFEAYVLEKPAPAEYKNKMKDGIHILFPKIIVPHSFQHFVRRKILDIAPTVFEGIPFTNTYDSIVDEAIIDKNNWQMYGSCKPDNPCYRVTHIYNYQSHDAPLLRQPDIPAKDELDLVSLFSMRSILPPLSYAPDKSDEIDEYVRIILPTTMNRRKDKLHQQIFGTAANLVRTTVSDEELEMAKKLVGCLNKNRADNYEEWIKLGWTLRNIDDRLLKTWVDFSQVSTKYVSGECEKLWSRMRMDTLGIGSLHYWAKQDNAAEYNKISDDNVLTLIDRCIGSKGAHFDVARVVHAMYKHQYRFTTRDTWYIFKEEKHRWVRSKEGLQLRLILSREVCMKFLDRAQYWNEQSIIHHDDQEKYQERARQLQDISLKLKSSGYKDSVMKECKAQFCDEKFEELLDSHAHLIGFENGVYDLRLHEFREGIPDDYISFSTGRNYIPFNPNAVETQEINEFLAQVFTNPAVCKYVKDILSSTLDGGIRHEKFYICTGNGSNSKSKILELVQKMVGEYYCILPISLLTQKRAASNSAQAELERTRGRRFAVMQEPSEGEKINIGLMKELSGGDRIMTRGLFKDPIEFKPQFKMIMTCNELPEVPSDDGGTWRRIRVIDFSSKFVENPDPTNPKEFKMDTELAEKFDRWADMFMAMLIENHKQTDLRNIYEPTEVKAATNTYKKNNDLIGQYLDDTLVKDERSTTRHLFQNLLNDFKNWFGNNIPKNTKKIPDRNQFKAYLEKTMGAYPSDGRGWIGWRFKEAELDHVE
jgi:P4 family phage/plasmid primase-like protien